MKKMRVALSAVIAVLVFSGGDAWPLSKTSDKSRRLDPAEAIQLSEKAVGQRIGDHVLRDDKNRKLRLADLRGRPLIISPVYTSCATVCPLVTQHLLDAVTQAGEVLGGQRFNILTLGFDATADTPDRMAAFAKDQNVRMDNWHFATADRRTLRTLLEELGFSYASVAGGFDHITQTTIIDSDGTIYRHVYGDDFPIQVFVEPLKDVVFGTKRALSMGNFIDRFRYFCTTFDPTAGRYTTRYAETISGIIFGALSLIGVAYLIRREWKKSSAV